MEQEPKVVENENDTPEEESPYEAYGWEFHKKPLLYALIISILFYAFIFIFISI